jgi:hypothetical protein
MPRASRKRDPAQLDLPEYVHMHECSDELVLAAVHNVIVVVWRSPMTVPRMQRIEAFSKEFSPAHKPFGVLSIVEREIIAPPDPATREAAAQLTTTFQESCAGVALVMEGTSIKHVVLRMALSTLNLVSTAAVEKNVFDAVPAASRWLALRVPQLDEGELTQAVLAARAQPPR